MPYRSLVAANTILETGFRRSMKIDHMKLQKLMFFANGLHMAMTGHPLIQENFEAWPYGPVNPTVYRAFRNFGASEINNYALDYDPGDITPRPYVINHNDRQAYEIIERTWDKFGSYSAIELSDLTHLPDTPWDKARKRNDTQINNEDIQEYFNRLI